MHQLSPFTCRRLSQLPRLTSVWECDRRPLTASSGPFGDISAEGAQGECIMWADGLQGIVRGLSVVPPETGHEAIVRTLLQAIETPQGGVEPARPRKVIVRNREIQFFLRGALQDLDIPVEHVPTLPVIDEVFEKLKNAEPPVLKQPQAFEQLLKEKASLLWQDAPWQYLSEQEILAIELNRWEIETLYLSVLGLAGMEYGLLFYRELESLKQFRRKLLGSEDFSESMQQAFLEQNCLFINFNTVEGAIPISLFRDDQKDDDAADGASGRPRQKSGTQPTAVDYEFGSLHPLEGLRTQLAEEEAASLVVVLEALHRFFQKHDLSIEDFALQPVSNRFRIPNPLLSGIGKGNRIQSLPANSEAEKNRFGKAKDGKAAAPKNALSKKTTHNSAASKKVTEKSTTEKTVVQNAAAQTLKQKGELTGGETGKEKEPTNVTVKISTLPEVSALFLEETLGPPEAIDAAPLIDDSVPEGSLILLSSYPDEMLCPLREIEKIYYQSFLSPPESRPGKQSRWPILTIQTSRPKAKKLLKRFQQEGGIESICFNAGSDPMSGQIFQVGLLQTQQGNLHLFNEYEIDAPGDSRYLEKWTVGSAKNNQCCGCIIATGVTGTRRGKPTIREIVAFFEIYTKLPEELGLAPLVMSYAVD